MAELVYILCFLTSALCAFLLIRSHRQNRTRLLLWSSVCFAGLALNNGLLFASIIVPTLDTSVLRAVIALAAVGALIVGIIRDVH